MAGALLLDGDGGREPFDGVHVRLAHLLQELPRVGRERLHVAALPFGVDGIEGEGGLAGPAEARDDHKPVPRDLDVEILEIVLPCSADDDRAGHRRRDYNTGISGFGKSALCARRGCIFPTSWFQLFAPGPPRARGSISPWRPAWKRRPPRGFAVALGSCGL